MRPMQFRRRSPTHQQETRRPQRLNQLEKPQLLNTPRLIPAGRNAPSPELGAFRILRRQQCPDVKTSLAVNAEPSW